MLLSNDREKFFTLQDCRQKIVAVSHLATLSGVVNIFMKIVTLLYTGKYLAETTCAIVERPL